MEFRLLATHEDLARAERLTRAVQRAADGDRDDELASFADLTDHLVCVDDGDEADVERVIGAFDGDELVGTIAAQCWADRPFSGSFVEVFQTHRFATVVRREQMAAVTHVRVHPEHRTQALAARLIAIMWRYLSSRDVAVIFGDSQPHQLPWYSSLGMRPFGHPFNYAGGGIGIPLVGIPCDHDHLRRTRNVGLSFVTPDSEDPELAARFAEILDGNEPVTTMHTHPGVYREAIASVLDDESPISPNPFSRLTRADRQRIYESGYILRCGRGAQLMGRSQAGRTVFIVLEGELQIRQGAWHLHLGRGEICGEPIQSAVDVYVASKRAKVLCLSDDLARYLVSRNAVRRTTSPALVPLHRLAS